jgi:hypothetical protein
MDCIASAHGVFKNYSELISTVVSVLSRNGSPHSYFGGDVGKYKKQ